MKLLSLEMDHKYASLLKATSSEILFKAFLLQVFKKSQFLFPSHAWNLLDIRHRPGLSWFIRVVRRPQDSLQAQMGAGAANEFDAAAVRHNQRRRVNRATRNG
jgi:hypothetical protein